MTTAASYSNLVQELFSDDTSAIDGFTKVTFASVQASHGDATLLADWAAADGAMGANNTQVELTGAGYTFASAGSTTEAAAS